MNTLEGKIVLITGASSGIGAGTAKHFASLKCRLSLVGRNQEALNNVAEKCREKGAIEVLVLVKDLMAADACRDVVSSTVAHFECNFYLVQLIQTTNTNPQFVQSIFCLFTYEHFYKVTVFYLLNILAFVAEF